jgi:DNA-binding PadR family transcriptional regulator
MLFPCIYRFDILDAHPRKGSRKLLELAILGLLKERPMHGYALKKRLSYMLGHFWTVSYGSLYPALKEKTRNRNVFRITKHGESEFMRMLTEDLADTSLADTEKFDLRMAFFQYIEPETRLALLETRRKLLEEQVAKFKAYRSANGDEDHYRTGLMRHKVDLTKSDIRWLDRLMAHEKETIRKRDSVSGTSEIDIDTRERKISAASGA